MVLLECTTREAGDEFLVEKVKKNQDFYTFLKERANFLFLIHGAGVESSKDATKDETLDVVIPQMKLLLHDLDNKFK